MSPGLLLGFLGVLLIYGGIKGQHPWCPVLSAFGVACPPAPGTTSPIAQATGAGLKSGGAAFGAAAGTVMAPLASTEGSWRGIPGCIPPALVTWRGVTLSVPAMAAFQRAQAAANGRIQVGSSYRSCAQQWQVCLNHGCHPPECCPGTAAPVGQSYHQRGAAIDVSNWSFAIPYLLATGWCQSVPDTDPGHFSWGGCA